MPLVLPLSRVKVSATNTGSTVDGPRKRGRGRPQRSAIEQLPSGAGITPTARLTNPPSRQEIRTATVPAVKVLRPQKGQQEKFFASPADIVIYGGAAGGGKSYALLLEPLRHLKTKGFGAVIFRKTYPEITSKGGLWETSVGVYEGTGGIPRSSDAQWVWPNNVDVKFSHMQYDSDAYTWKGSQIPLICFDELTSFSEFAFFYMLSRNRSTCGVRPYVRATTNPDPDSWVAEFLSWWIDQTTGFPILERDGKVRYFVRQNGKMIWADKPEDLPQEKTPEGKIIPAKSVCFVRSNIYDNPILLEADPNYLGNLTSLPEVERKQLLDGNWKIRRTQGSYFKRDKARIITEVPPEAEMSAWCRGWDLASTEKTNENKNPDYTAGVLIGRRKNGRYVIADVRRERMRPGDVQQLILSMAMQDPRNTRVSLEQDPGSAGEFLIQEYAKLLTGYAFSANRVTDAKHVRWLPFSAQWEFGNVDVLKGSWNAPFFDEMESLGPDAKLYDHDDQADAGSTAFKNLTTSRLPGSYSL